MTTELEYQKNELKLFQHEQKQRDKLHIKDKRAAEFDIAEAIEKNYFSGRIESTVDHILSGNFGSGILIAYNVCNSRMNRAAWLFNHAVSINYVTSLDRARKTWNKISTPDQIELNAAIKHMVADYDQEPVIKNVF